MVTGPVTHFMRQLAKSQFGTTQLGHEQKALRLCTVLGLSKLRVVQRECKASEAVEVVRVKAVEVALRDPHALLGLHVALRPAVVLRQLEDVVAGALKELPAVVDFLLDHELDHK